MWTLKYPQMHFLDHLQSKLFLFSNYFSLAVSIEIIKQFTYFPHAQGIHNSH